MRVTMKTNRILVGNRWVALAPGMSVTAEVKTGKRRAIEFFLSPLMRYQDEALRER
jgi:hemolysin D